MDCRRVNYQVKRIDGGLAVFETKVQEPVSFRSHWPECKQQIWKLDEFQEVAKLLKESCSKKNINEDRSYLLRAVTQELYIDLLIRSSIKRPDVKRWNTIANTGWFANSKPALMRGDRDSSEVYWFGIKVWELSRGVNLQPRNSSLASTRVAASTFRDIPGAPFTAFSSKVAGYMSIHTELIPLTIWIKYNRGSSIDSFT